MRREDSQVLIFTLSECFTEIGLFTNAVQCVEVMVDTEAGTEDRTFASRTVRNESFTVKTVLNCEL